MQVCIYIISFHDSKLYLSIDKKITPKEKVGIAEVLEKARKRPLKQTVDSDTEVY